MVQHQIPCKWLNASNLIGILVYLVAGKAWQPSPVFLLGKSHGQRSLLVYSPWGCKESDMTEQLTLNVTE